MRPAAGERMATDVEGDAKGSLADRIRALQSKASRVPVPN
jgi:hypothetical protein